MKPSASRILIAALGLLVASPLARADDLGDGRAALSQGDFATAKTRFDAHLANEANPSLDDARVLRAFARLGLAIETDLPAALRAKLGANVAELDLGGGGLALRFPRPFGYFSRYHGQVIPGFTTTKPFYQYDPALDLYAPPENPEAPPLPQPSISFENRGATAYPLTLTVSQPGADVFHFDTTLYLDGVVLGFVNAFGGYDFEVFPAPLFDVGPDIPKPFDLDLSTPDHYLSAGAEANSFTVVIPPKSNFTLGLVLSGGNLRFTPSAPLPSSVKVLNGKAGGIAQPRLANGANLSHLFALAAQLEASSLAPAIADLEAVTPDVNLVLAPEETGASIDTIIAYPDVQMVLSELKFLRGLRRLGGSYNFALPLTPANLRTDLGQLLAKNPGLLSPLAPNKARTQDRLLARQLFTEAADHYASASEHGLWNRSAPLGGAYLFNTPDGDLTQIRDAADGLVEELARAMTETIPLTDSLAASETEMPVGAGFSFAPLFGSPAVNFRKILPVTTDAGVVRGGSLALLTSGFLPGVGTTAWETFLENNDHVDLGAPAIQTPAKIQRQPAALTSVPEGDPVTLAVVAEAYPAPTYKWYRRSGKSEQLVAEGSPFLFIEAARRDDAGNYFVRVSNTVAPPPPRKPVTTTKTSTTAVLQVTYAPEIVAAPADVARYQGKTVVLDATAVGVPKPTYQWFKGDTAVTAARASSKYTFAASAAKAGDYHVVVKNSVGETTSETVTVDVQTKPVFAEHPQARTVVVGGSVTFTAAATGNPAPQIKWRKNGRDIPGATGPSYTIEAASLDDRGTYTAVAYGTVSTGPSSTAVVTAVSKGARLAVVAGLGAAM